MSQEGSKQIFWIEDKIVIPPEYEMIEAANVNYAAYINTGLQLVGRDAKIEGYAVATRQSSYIEWNVLVGAETSDNSDDCIKIRVQADRPLLMCANFDGAHQDTYLPIQLNKMFYFCLEGLDFTIDGQTRHLTRTSQVKSPDIFIGNENCGGKPWGTYGSRFWIGAIGLIRFFDLGKLVGQFIPCRRMSDNICGFYDTVTKRFMPSLTSTQFTEWQSA